MSARYGTAMRTLWLMGATLVACGSNDGESGATPADTADTGSEVDTGDSGDSGDSADTADTGVEPDLSFVLAGEFDRTMLTLTWLDPTSIGTESLLFGEVLSATPVTGSPQRLNPPVPEPTALFEIDPVNYPGLLLALYVPALVNEYGLYVGAGTTWPAYVTGSISSELGMAGVHEGWNALDISGGEAEPAFADPLAIPLMGASAGVTVGGTYAGQIDGFGLTLVSYSALSAGVLVDPLYDAAATAEWSVRIGDKPPPDHLAYLDFMGVEGALEVPVSYADVDASGAYNEGDTLMWPACEAGLAVGLLWVPGVADLAAALSLTMSGATTGWVPARLGGEGGIVDEVSRMALTIDETCTLDN